MLSELSLDRAAANDVVDGFGIDPLLHALDHPDERVVAEAIRTLYNIAFDGTPAPCVPAAFRTLLISARCCLPFSDHALLGGHTEGNQIEIVDAGVLDMMLVLASHRNPEIARLAVGCVVRLSGPDRPCVCGGDGRLTHSGHVWRCDCV